MNVTFSFHSLGAPLSFSSCCECISLL